MTLGDSRMSGKKKHEKEKKKISVRLPVGPPSRPHETKAEYRRAREKERLRRAAEEPKEEKAEEAEKETGSEEGHGDSESDLSES